ncbi:MAG: PSD1 and planctomycete cytochrome C domain-containing protein [Planctomycetaceae bacterium]
MVSLVATQANGQEADFFSKDVLPILQKRCYSCHSRNGGKLEGNLALDWKSGWATGGDSGPAVVPGKPEESPLIEAVKRTGLEMPPDERLPAEEVAILVKWVELGAPDPRTTQPESKRPDADWWSLKPLAQPEVPVVAGMPHPIDAFIDAKLHEQGLQRSSQANRATLIRRACIDLHGLPPTPEEVREFVNDNSPDAWPRLIDRLLESPRYGERWARHWLDVVHFADTHGFEHDVFRPNAWQYRDYVIQAFNNDTPWSDFIRQQLAADVYFPEQSNLIAGLGYIGAGPFDLSTASTAPVTFDYMDRDDMVAQTMAAFVSTTANCARCHAHKFDPITQEDYYSLQAVFAGVGKGDRTFDADPAIDEQRRHWTALLNAANQNQGDVLLAPEHAEQVQQWEAAYHSGPVVWSDLDIVQFVSTDGADLQRLVDGSIRAGGTRPDVDTYSLTTTSGLTSITAVRLDVLADETLPMHGPGRQDNGNLHLTEVEIQVFNPGASTPLRIPIAAATADFNQAGWTISHALDGELKTAWGIYPEVGKSHYAIFQLTEPLELASDSKLVILLKQRHGGGHLIGRLKLSATDVPAEQALAVPQEVEQVLAVPVGQRSPEQQVSLAAYVLKNFATSELKRLPDPAKVYAVSTMWQRGAEQGAPIPLKEVHVLARGNIEKPTELVTPGALSAIDSLTGRFNEIDLTNEAARRAALADWIAHPDNPLTWRSIANRVWHYHFGRGLCDTPNDFGRMGGAPSHPELLDWLACELRENGGSLKKLHRVIMTSETYQQSSQSNADGEAVDADNRLLWRANRNRLDAESFFDSVLQVSGRINFEMGGPGIQHFTLTPGQQATPQVHYDKFDWSHDDGSRRAIYRVVWRGIPDPLFEALDFPDLGLLVGKRAESVSALQSLTLWNHPFVLHHCELTAQPIAAEHESQEDQISRAYQIVLLRNPTEAELDACRQYHTEFGLAALVRVLLSSNEFLFVD